MTIVIILVCLLATATAGKLYLRAQRRKPRKRAASRYFAVDLTERDLPAPPTDPKP